MKIQIHGDPCPRCGGTDFYCAEEVDAKIDRLEADLHTAGRQVFRAEGDATRAKLELAQSRQSQKCGHPLFAIITNGEEGTSYCGWCEGEAAQYHAGHKRALADIYRALFCKEPPETLPIAVLVAKVRAAWLAADAPCWEE